MSDDLRIDLNTQPAEENLERLNAKINKTGQTLQELISDFVSFGSTVKNSVTIDVKAAFTTSKNDLRRQIKEATSGLSLNLDMGVSVKKTAVKSAIAEINKQVMDGGSAYALSVPVVASKSSIRKMVKEVNDAVKDASVKIKTVSDIDSKGKKQIIDIGVDSKKIRASIESALSGPFKIDIKATPDVSGYKDYSSRSLEKSSAKNIPVRDMKAEYNDADRRRSTGMDYQKMVKDLSSKASSVTYVNQDHILEILQRKMLSGKLSPAGYGSQGDLDMLRMKTPNDFMKGKIESFNNALSKFASSLGVAEKELFVASEDLLKHTKSGIAKIDNGLVVDSERIRKGMNVGGNKGAAEFLASGYVDDIKKSIFASDPKSTTDLFRKSFESSGFNGKFSEYINKSIIDMLVSGTKDINLQEIARKNILPMLSGQELEYAEQSLKHGTRGLVKFNQSQFSSDDTYKIKSEEFKSQKVEDRQYNESLYNERRATSLLEADLLYTKRRHDSLLEAELTYIKRRDDARAFSDNLYQQRRADALLESENTYIRHRDENRIYNEQRQTQNTRDSRDYFQSEKKENRQYMEARDLSNEMKRVGEAAKNQGNAFEHFMQGARKGFIEWGLSMSGIAASIFVFQQVSQIVSQLATNFDDAAMASSNLSRQVSLSANQFNDSDSFIKKLRKENGFSTEETTSAIASIMKAGGSYEDSKKLSSDVAKITKAGLTNDSDQAAQVMINDMYGMKEAYLEFIKVTDDTYTANFERLGGAVDNLKGSFEDAFGDDIKNSIQWLTDFINENKESIVDLAGVMKDAVKTIGMLTAAYAAYKTVSMFNKKGFIENETNRIMSASLNNSEADHISRLTGQNVSGKSKFDARNEAIAMQKGQRDPSFAMSNIGAGAVSVGKSLLIGGGITVASFAAEKLLEVMFDVYNLNERMNKSQEDFAKKLGVSAEAYKKLKVNGASGGSEDFKALFDEMSITQKKEFTENITKQKSELKKQLETITIMQKVMHSPMAGGAIADIMYGDPVLGKNYKGEIPTPLDASTKGYKSDKVKEIAVQFKQLEEMQAYAAKWNEESGDMLGNKTSRQFEDVQTAYKGLYESLGITSKSFREDMIAADINMYNTLVTSAKENGKKINIIISDASLKRIGIAREEGDKVNKYFADEMKEKAKILKDYEASKAMYDKTGFDSDEYFKASAENEFQGIKVNMRHLGASEEDIKKSKQSMLEMFFGNTKKESASADLSVLENALEKMGADAALFVEKNKDILIKAFVEGLKRKTGSEKEAGELAEAILGTMGFDNLSKELSDSLDKRLKNFKITGKDLGIGAAASEKAVHDMRALPEITSKELSAMYNGKSPAEASGIKDEKQFIEIADSLYKSFSKIKEGKYDEVFAYKEKNKALSDLYAMYEDVKMMSLNNSMTERSRKGEDATTLNDFENLELKGAMVAKHTNLFNQGKYANADIYQKAIDADIENYKKELKEQKEQYIISLNDSIPGSMKKEVGDIKTKEKIEDLRKNFYGSNENLDSLSKILGMSSNKALLDESVRTKAEIVSKWLEQSGEGLDESIKANVESRMLDFRKYNLDEAILVNVRDAIKKSSESDFDSSKIEELNTVFSELYEKTGTGIDKLLATMTMKNMKDFGRVFGKTSVSMADANTVARSDFMKDFFTERKDAFIKMISSGISISDNEHMELPSEVVEELKNSFMMSDESIKRLMQNIGSSAINDSIEQMKEKLETGEIAGNNAVQSTIKSMKKAYQDRLTMAFERGLVDGNQAEKLNKLFNINTFQGDNAPQNANRMNTMAPLIDAAEEYYRKTGAMSDELMEKENRALDALYEKYKIIGADRVKTEKEVAALKRQNELANAMFTGGKLYEGFGSEAVDTTGIDKGNISAAAAGFTSFYDDSIDQMKRWKEFGEETASSFENAVVDACKGSTSSFREFTESVIQDFAAMMIKMQLNTFMTETINPMISTGVSSLVGMFSGTGLASAFSTSSVPSGWFGGVGSAKGDAFIGGMKAFKDGGFFTNSIVSNPTPFRFASGNGFNLGVMGEAGPEAIVPLARDSSGSLGVKSIGGNEKNSGVEIEIHIINESKEPVEASSATAKFDETGKLICNVVINAIQTNQGGLRNIIKNTARQ